MNIAIIGAGASGIVAALQAAWHGAHVTLYERNAIVGRKLLVTGSGRCNITNDAAAALKYACDDPFWMERLLGRFGVPELLAMLDEVGIPVYKTDDGWYYPLSNSAQTVVDAFASALQIAGVTVCTNTRVTGIQPLKPGFRLHLQEESTQSAVVFERVIVSAGGKAYPSLGSRGELFAVLAQLGHRVLPLRPALAPVLADLGALKAWQGVRLDVGATLWQGRQRLASARGNLIVTQWGLNGPAVMDISHQVSAHPDAALSLSLNLLAFNQPAFDQLLAHKRGTPLLLTVFLGAFFPPKVAPLALQQAHLAPDARLDRISDGELARLVRWLQDIRLAVRGVRDFEYCQVSAGGVPVEEVDPQTLESRKVKGLYLTGETLDVVGPCGGYNLQYAFSSGAMAGLAAAGAQ